MSNHVYGIFPNLQVCHLDLCMKLGVLDCLCEEYYEKWDRIPSQVRPELYILHSIKNDVDTYKDLLDPMIRQGVVGWYGWYGWYKWYSFFALADAILNNCFHRFQIVDDQLKTYMSPESQAGVCYFLPFSYTLFCHGLRRMIANCAFLGDAVFCQQQSPVNQLQQARFEPQEHHV